MPGSGGDLARRGKYSAATYFRRLNFHPQERFDALEHLLCEPGSPSVVVLVGEEGCGRGYFVEAAAHFLSTPKKPAHHLRLDLEGFSEEGSLADYLEHQLRKRGALKEQNSAELRKALLELGEKVLKVSSLSAASVISLLLDVAKPLWTIKRLVEQAESSYSGPTLLDQEVVADLLEELEGPVLIQVSDPTMFPRVRSPESPWRWLPEKVRAADQCLLTVSCTSSAELEDLVRQDMAEIEFPPLTRAEVQAILDERFAPHEFPAELATALVDYARSSGLAVFPGLVARGMRRLYDGNAIEQVRPSDSPEQAPLVWRLDMAVARNALQHGLYEGISRVLYELDAQQARAVEEFLFDAALCGDLVPARLVLARQQLTEDREEEIEDLVEEILVEKLGVFEDLQYQVRTFAKHATYVYRFLDPLLRLVIIDQMSAGDAESRARGLLAFLKAKLPVTSRDVARLFLELAEHAGADERERWRSQLAWWVGTDQAKKLELLLTEELRSKRMDPEVVWTVAREAKEWPPYRRLAALDAYKHGCEMPHDRLGQFLLLRAELFLEDGKYRESRDDATEAVRFFEARGDSPDLVRTLVARGVALNRTGEFLAAEQALRRAIALSAGLSGLGEEHPFTLTARHNLASVLQSLGEYRSARTEYESVLAVERRVLGEEHPSTLITRHALAGPLNSLGEYSSARSECQAVLVGWRRVLGEEHPWTLVTRGSLASVLNSLGEHASARSESESVLQGFRRLYGAKHPWTLEMIATHAVVVAAQGDPAAAREEMNSALAEARKIAGDKATWVLRMRRELGSILRCTGDFAAARAELEGAVELGEASLGDEHPEVLFARRELAWVLDAKGDSSEAATKLEAVLASQVRKLGAEHPEVARTRSVYARALQAQRKTVKARREREAALNGLQSQLGERHPWVLEVRHDLARDLEVHGELRLAHEMYEQVLKARLQVLGKEHPDTTLTEQALVALLG